MAKETARRREKRLDKHKKSLWDNSRRHCIEF
jgi:hypothetical protein